jgi:DNA-binding MarR family transcriptional regulator
MVNVDPENQAVKPPASPDTLRDNAAALFLDQYYPFHYEVGFTIERHMRDPLLTQHQTVILWIIHASVGDRGRMPRKAIEWQLRLWFDVTSSAISKALRGMAREPLHLLLIEENPNSAREKYVSLTAAGRQMVGDMNARGRAIVQRIVDRMSQQEIEQGLHFLRQVSNIVRNLPAETAQQPSGGTNDPR